MFARCEHHYVDYRARPQAHWTQSSAKLPNRRVRSAVTSRAKLLRAYQLMLDALGPQHWWPSRTRFETIVGAILTQNTSWGNAAKAIQALRRERLLSAKKLLAVPEARLARIIAPARFQNVKARRLRHFLLWFESTYGSSLRRMFTTPLPRLREELLSVNGIGPETADSILLYAGDLPTFVVDAYTRRVLSRHGLVGADATYDEMKDLFERRLEPDATLYNEYHALIVAVGSRFCGTKPRCDECPLRPMLPRER